MAKALAQISIVRSGEDYLITLEDADGGTAKYSADDEQLAQITDAVEEAMDSDEEAELEEEDEDEE